MKYYIVQQVKFRNIQMLPDTTLQLKPWLVLKRFGGGRLISTDH